MNERQAASAADSLRGLVRKRLKIRGDQVLNCPNAKSEMTPCAARDGGTTVCEIAGGWACVGCEQLIEPMLAAERAKHPRGPTW